MSIVERLKHMKPKHWAGALAALGAGGLAVNYLVVGKDRSLVVRAWRRIHGSHPGPMAKPRLPAHHPAAHPPLPPGRPSSAVYAEPTAPPMPGGVVPPIPFAPPPMGFPPGGLVEEFVEAPMWTGPQYGYGMHPFMHHGMHPGFHHHDHFHVGGPGGDGGPVGPVPVAPAPTRSVIPPPGAFGVVSQTPPAPTDPEAQNGSVYASPCGAGLTFDPATGSCVPSRAPYPWAQ